jgi:hypothetical protein
MGIFNCFRFLRNALFLVFVVGILCSTACSTAFGFFPPHKRVPEIDPGSAASGVTLLLGAVLLLTDKSRRR